MRLKVEEIGPGLHPSEALVKIETLEGPQEIAVNRRSISQNTIDVGQPIAAHQRRFFLIELPAETSNGAWRVWVGDDALASEALEAAE